MYNRVHFFQVPGLWWLVGLVCLGVLVVAIVGLVMAVTRHDRYRPQQPGPWQPPYAGTPAAPGVPPVNPGYSALPPRPTPHDILRERLARGEIAVEEFERTKAALGPDPYGPDPHAPQPPQAM